MTETGIIREVKGNLAVIAPDKSAACFGCMNLECKSSVGLITAENPDALPLQTGQRVEVGAPGLSLLHQAITAFLPPILAFIAGFFLTRQFFPQAGEGAAAFAGVILLFAAAFVVYKARGKSNAKSEFYITRVIS